MIVYKCHNVCYYRGGSKAPFRIRKYQNITLQLDKECTKEEIINILYWRGFYPVRGFKIKRLNKLERLQ